MSETVHEDPTPLAAGLPKESPHSELQVVSPQALAAGESGGALLAAAGGRCDNNRAALALAMQRTVGNRAVSRFLQRDRGNAALTRILARKEFATVEEAILDEIVHDRRPDRLRELFDSVPAANARSLAEVRLREGTRDALGVRFNGDLPADLRAELLALLRNKYAPPPPSTDTPTSGPDSAPSTELFEVQPDPDTGSFRIVQTPSDPNYVDNRVTSVARFLGGPGDYYLLFVDDVDVGPDMSPPQLLAALAGKKAPVRLEPWRIESSRTKSTPAAPWPFADRDSALAAVVSESSAHKGVTYHAYHKAVYDMIVPTVFSPATTPRIAAAIQGVEKARAEAARDNEELFKVMAVEMAMALVAEALAGVGGLIANRNGRSTEPDQPPSPRADKGPSGIAHEITTLTNANPEILASEVLPQYTPQSGFSAAYNPTADKWVAVASGDATLLSGRPIKTVPPLGGHADAEAALMARIGAGANARENVGFVVIWEGNNSVSLRWNSRTINERNFGGRAAPLASRPAIRAAVETTTGCKVIE
jgi:hypothetical protein